MDKKCRIHIVSYRKRLADADGISAKAAIDGLILGGVLRDDSPEEVEEVTFAQVKTKGDERTEITVWQPCRGAQQGAKKNINLINSSAQNNRWK